MTITYQDDEGVHIVHVKPSAEWGASSLRLNPSVTIMRVELGPEDATDEMTLTHLRENLFPRMTMPAHCQYCFHELK